MNSPLRYAQECRASWFEKLARFGALTTEDFMAHCLTDSRFGYYRHARLGQDFITAPMLCAEFSRIVGDWLAFWLVKNYENFPPSREIMLVEAGGGRGELLFDVLKSLTRHCPQLVPRIYVHLIEVNADFRDCQAQVLRQFKLRGCAFHESIDGVSEGIWIFIANEFFDALPMRQYLLQPSLDASASYMRRIAISDAGVDKRDSLCFVRGESRVLPRSLQSAFCGEREERIVEFSPRALGIASQLSYMLQEFGGAAFICDYGYSSLRSAKQHGSLQAFYRHESVDPLTRIGLCDLSAEVDFESLSNEFSGLDECELSTQASFLRRAGIEELALRAKNASSVKKLLDAEAMGERFKVLTASHAP